MTLVDFMRNHNLDPNNVEDLEVVADFLGSVNIARHYPEWPKEFYEMALDTIASAMKVCYMARKMATRY